MVKEGKLLKYSSDTYSLKKIMIWEICYYEIKLYIE